MKGRQKPFRGALLRSQDGVREAEETTIILFLLWLVWGTDHFMEVSRPFTAPSHRFLAVRAFCRHNAVYDRGDVLLLQNHSRCV